MPTKVFVTALLILTLSVIKYAQAAPTIAAQPCDAKYWESMSSRAWMEAEREIMQNQNLIFKPDSVFEYTCFDRILAHVATNAGAIFSHTTYFNSTPIIQPNDTLGLRNSLGMAVYEALKVYIKDNYGHKFMGGRAGFMNANSADTNMNLSATPANYTALFSGSYGTCKIMSDIWQTSKCGNFVDNNAFDGSTSSQTSDGFYPFNALKDNSGSTVIGGYKDTIKEARGLPQNCSGATSAMGGWGNNITRATNTNLSGNDVLYQFKTPLKTVFKNVYDLTAPKNKTTSGQCGAAIPTGVTVYSKAFPKGKPDAVCSNPGCTYNASSNKCQ